MIHCSSVNEYFFSCDHELCACVCVCVCVCVQLMKIIIDFPEDRLEAEVIALGLFAAFLHS